MEEQLRVVLLGLGRIGRRHATIVQQHPQTELVAVIDPAPGATRWEGLQPEVARFTDWQSFRAANQPADVAIIATPNGLHTELASLALQAGLHTVVEKPLGLRSEACQQLLALARRQQRELFVVMQNRFSPQARWLKEVVAAGHLGELLDVQVNCLWNRDDRYYLPGSWRGSLELDGGVLYTQFSHFVDILYWVFGPMAVRNARFANLTHRHNTAFEDTGWVWFDFEQGGHGAMHYSTAVWDSNLESSIRVLGTRGSLVIGGQYMNTLSSCHIEGYIPPDLPPAKPPNQYGAYTGSAANHQFMLENVLETLLEEGQPIATAQEGLAVVQFIEDVYAYRNLPQLRQPQQLRS